MNRHVPRNYILDDDGHPVLEPDLVTWAEWFGTHHDERIVKQTMVGDTEVSTVFLGIDHGFSLAPEAPPILFETMLFRADGGFDDVQERYATREEALTRHAEIVQELEAKL